MTPDLATLRASLTEGQRAELRRQVEAIPCCPCCTEIARADYERRILVAIRTEQYCLDRFLVAARAVLAAKAPAEPQAALSRGDA